MREPPFHDPERLRQIFDSAVDTGIILLDLDARVTAWSEGASRLLGWNEVEMLGDTLHRIFPEASAMEQELSSARTHGKGGGEGWRRRKDGSRLWAVGETTRLSDKAGELVGFVKILRDRTDQRNLVDSLRRRTNALETLNRAAAALARESDLQKIVQLATDAGVELTGAQFGAFFYNVVNESGESYTLYTLSGVARESFADFPMPRNTAVFAPTFQGREIVRSGDITKDRRYGKNAPRNGMPEGHLPVRSYLAVPVVSRTGEVLGGLFFGHSETDQFDDESERGLAGLAGEAAVAIDNTRLQDEAQRELTERRRAEDALRDLNANLELLVEQKSRELEQSAQALRQAQKMEAIGQLTGGVAHDFNNLLQVITGNLDILSRHLPEEPVRLRRAAAQAMNGAKRAAALTQRLLAFARRQALNPKPLDVNALVRTMSELLHRTLGEIYEIEIVLAGGLWQTEADPNELESAILNLAINARDAMPAGGKLTVETFNSYLDEAYGAQHAEVNPGQYIAVCVSDTGTGMDSETMSRVFEPFFTTKEQGRGTGLGLSQVYGFVKQSQGHVKIYSELGVGTTVKIYLPRLTSQQTEQEVVEAPLIPESAGETILVIEDDVDVREYTVESLKELGYRVLEAVSGPMAMQIFRSSAHIDLVFTDVVLPGGMNGADIVREARLLRPSVKALFTTGYSRNAIVHQGRLDKGVELLGKPFSLEDLAAKVRDILDRPH